MKIHENMLFRWVGYDIEMGDEYAKLQAPKRPKIPINSELTDPQRKKYLDWLRDAFDPAKGLKVSQYHSQDKVGKHHEATEPRNCLFFTEQAASDAEQHWQRYGRMGFGFSKRAIFNRGGSPVIYTGGKDSELEKSIDVLRRYLIEAEADHKVVDALEVFARFVKVTRMPKDEASKDGTKTKTSGKGEVAAMRKPDPMAYPTEQRIRFLAEREWRLLVNVKQKDLWKQCSDGWLWYRPQLGHELQLVILPDNRTLSMAIECSKIRKALIVKNRPPVQLITADAIKKI
jgi:hypothetical protein